MDTRRAALGITTSLSEGQAHPDYPELREFVRLSQDALQDLERLLRTAKDNPHLTAVALEPLLRRTQDLAGRLEVLAASLG